MKINEYRQPLESKIQISCNHIRRDSLLRSTRCGIFELFSLPNVVEFVQFLKLYK